MEAFLDPTSLVTSKETNVSARKEVEGCASSFSERVLVKGRRNEECVGERKKE